MSGNRFYEIIGVKQKRCLNGVSYCASESRTKFT